MSVLNAAVCVGDLQYKGRLVNIGIADDSVTVPLILLYIASRIGDTLARK